MSDLWINFSFTYLWISNRKIIHEKIHKKEILKIDASLDLPLRILIDVNFTAWSIIHIFGRKMNRQILVFFLKEERSFQIYLEKCLSKIKFLSMN